jgi:hypothetical protein
MVGVYEAFTSSCSGFFGLLEKGLKNPPDGTLVIGARSTHCGHETHGIMSGTFERTLEETKNQGDKYL